MSEERCVCCGEIIPEGRQVCQRCVNDAYYFKKDEEPEFREAYKDLIGHYDWYKIFFILLLIACVFIFMNKSCAAQDGACIETEPTAAIETLEPMVTVEPTEPVETTPTEQVETTEPPSTEPITPIETPSTEPTEGSSEASRAPVPEEAEHLVDPDELEMLACVIYQEAGGNGSCDDCRRYVADIVLNRVAHSKFPNTIKSVLTAQGQYGLFYYTGIKWAERAKNETEKEAVERAYRIAKEVLTGQHSKLYGEGYIWQARFVQGTEGFWCCGHWYGR